MLAREPGREWPGLNVFGLREERCETLLARLLGRGGAMLVVAGDGRSNEGRLGLFLIVGTRDGVDWSASGREAVLLIMLPVVRFLLLRTVTEAGMVWDMAALRGEAFGGVSVGAGSLDLAVWTRSSSFCILPRRLRRW